MSGLKTPFHAQPVSPADIPFKQVALFPDKSVYVEPLIVKSPTSYKYVELFVVRES